MFGAIEAGGTKVVCATGTHPGDLYRESFSTRAPQETLEQVVDFFRRRPVKAIGLGSFGPLDLSPSSPTYGYVTSTPKEFWRNFNLLGWLQEALRVPVALDTDVNAAALGEREWGAATGLRDFLYITVGTGVGGGAIVDGSPIHGLVHPEMGHVQVPRDLAADPYPGICPYHGDCLEGLVSGPAIAARAGQSAETLDPEHPIWSAIADYLAVACVNWCFTLSPQRIILGGGVLKNSKLFPAVRRRFQALLNGYVPATALEHNLDSYIVPPALGDNSGVLGAIVLARDLPSRG